MKKRCIVAAVCCALLCFALSAAAEEMQFAVITQTKTLNLRQNASQSSKLLGSYPAGDWVRVDGNSGSWYRVTASDGKSGWMLKKYLKVPEILYSDVGYVANPQKSRFLNLRAAPSYDAQVLAIYYNSMPFTLLDQSNGWVHARINGQEGYFRKEYVRINWHVPWSERIATAVTPNNGALNLRLGPGYGYPAISQIYGGEYVMVLQEGTSWCQVSANGMMGYMSAAFLKKGILMPKEAAAAGQGSGASAGGKNVSGVNAYVNIPKKTQVINMRAAAGTDARVVGRYVNGTRLNVLAQGMEWCRVQVIKTGETGYMMTDYLKLYGLPATPEKTVSHPNQSWVNMRKSASMKGDVELQIPHGARVIILSPGATWTKIRYEGSTGYVMTAYLK